MGLDTLTTRFESAQKHRSRIQILADIFIIYSNEQVSQTEIIDLAKLHYRQIRRYLDWLVTTNLLETTVKPNKSIAYQTTAKGYRLLEILDTIQKLLRNAKYLNITSIRPS